MSKTRVLITVMTYPLPSRSYDELVCTAGIREDGSWIRIYPIPFQSLKYRKWQWVELELIPQNKLHDFRPESFKPKRFDLDDLVIIKKLGTKQGWHERRQACLQNVYTNLATLIKDSEHPQNVSLAAFRPKRLVEFIVEPDDREWNEKWLEQLRQVDMFSDGQHAGDGPRVPIDKIPYKFKYHFEDDVAQPSIMTIEDWEIGALYRNCLTAAEDDESVAVKKVREKYEQEFMRDKDIVLFLGTTLKHHRSRHRNPFTIIGVFYPPRQPQRQLF